MKRIVYIMCIVLSFNGISQSTCDSLEIVRINVDAFFENQLNITLLNTNTQEIFDYPGFRVFDENDNLIGEEEVFFFGISGESTHSITFDTSSFSFLQGEQHTIKLELWTDFYANLACSFEVLATPVPTLDDCIPIAITFLEFSTEEVSYDWQLTDFWGNIIQEETLVFSSNVGSITRNVCLDQSCFFLNASSTLEPEFSTLHVNVIADMNYGFISTPLLEMSNDSSMIFSIWTDCSLINSSSEIQSPKFEIYPNPANDFLILQGELPLNFRYSILDLNGRMISNGVSSISGSRVSTAFLENGIYILEIDLGEQSAYRKFIKN